MPKALFTMTALGAAALWIALGVWLPGWLIGVAVAAAAVWLVATPAGRRTGAITAAGMATLPQRLGGASVALVGIAGVVGVLIALLAMGKGFQATLQATGNADTAIVLSLSAQSEVDSMLDQTSVRLIGNEPQVLRCAARAARHAPPCGRCACRVVMSGPTASTSLLALAVLASGMRRRSETV